jgi:hypothetical protein
MEIQWKDKIHPANHGALPVCNAAAQLPPFLQEFSAQGVKLTLKTEFTKDLTEEVWSVIYGKITTAVRILCPALFFCYSFALCNSLTLCYSFDVR